MTETGHLRPDRTLAKIFSGVARDIQDEEHGAVKSATNKALLDFLEDADDHVVRYNLEQAGFDTLDELEESVRGRQQLAFPNGGGSGDE